MLYSVIATKKELKRVEKKVDSEGLPITEVRSISRLELVQLGAKPGAFRKLFWVIFEATEEQYKTLVRKLDLKEVF